MLAGLELKILPTTNRISILVRWGDRNVWGDRFISPHRDRSPQSAIGFDWAIALFAYTAIEIPQSAIGFEQAIALASY
jgi:hypothetical protein